MPINRMQLVFVPNGPSSGPYPVVCQPGVPDIPYLASPVTPFVLSAGHRRDVGVMVHDVDDDAGCWVMKHGLVRNCLPEWSGWSVGDVLWADTSGQATNQRPTADQVRVQIGCVYREATSDGMGGWNPDAHVMVNVRVIPPIGELSGVDLETLPPAAGQVLMVDTVGATLGIVNKAPTFLQRRWVWMLG